LPADAVVGGHRLVAASELLIEAAMTPLSPVQSEPSDFDTGPLSWVMKEIREALQRSRNLLDEAMAQAPEAQATSLRQARAFLHQAHGALQIVDIDGLGLITEALERMLDQGLDGKPALTLAAAATYGEAAMALVEYLEELLSGASHQPVRLYPYYKAVQAACGNDKAHPSDLFFPNLAIRPQLAGEQQGRSLDFGALRQHFERALLPFLRSTDAAACKAAATQMAAVVAQVERAQGNADARRFWWVLRGFVEGVALGEIAPEVHVRQLFGRINLQLRKLAQGETAPVERLLRDALFFIAAAGRPSGRTAQVQSAYQLAGQISGDYETKRYGRLDHTVLAEARERLSQAKTLWARLVNGDVSVAAEFEKQMQALASAGARLHAPALEKLLRELNGIARAAHSQPGDALALEMASSLLFVESALQHASRLSESFAQRAEALSARLLAVVAGEQPDPSTQWLDDLSRDAQQKETVAVLAGEMRTSLNQVEKGLEEFFVNGSQRAGLSTVDQTLHQIEGALSILEQDEAVQAIADTRAAVAEMRKLPDEASASPAEAQRVARNLGALSFFLETLQVQASAARERFAFDAASRSFAERVVDPASRAALEVVVDPLPESLAAAEVASAAPTPAQAPAPAVPMLDAVLATAGPSASAAASTAASSAPSPAVATNILQPGLPTDNGEASGAHVVQPTLSPIVAAAAGSATSTPASSASDADVDAELLGIFLGEAEEVLACVRETLPQLAHNQASTEHLTTARRSFHTLKGSGRMVGLVEFGEAAWAVEQTLNLLLADGKPVNRDVQGLLHAATELLEAWVSDLRTHGSSQCRPDAIAAAARQVREGGAFVLAPQVQAVAEAEVAPEIPADLAASAPVPVPSVAQAKTVASVPTLPTLPTINDEAEFKVDVGPVANSTDADFTLTIETEPAGREATASADESDLPPLDFTDLLPPTSSPEPVDLVLADSDRLPTGGIETVELSFDLDSGALELEPPLESPVAESNTPVIATLTELPAFTLDAVQPETPQTPSVDDEPGMNAGTSPDRSDPATLPASPQSPDLTSITAAPAQPDTVPARAAVIDLAAVRSAPEPRADDNIKRIGTLEISLPLYTIYLAETDDLVRLLGNDLDEWRHEPDRMVHTASVHAAHSLSGSSATVGCEPVHELAHAMELILQALVRRPVQLLGSDFLLMQDTVARMKDMLATFARGEMPQAESALAAALEGRLADLALRPGLFDHNGPAPALAPVAADLATQVAAADLAKLPTTPLPADELDSDLLPVFLEEGGDMLPQIGRELRDWYQEPQIASHPAQVLRLLHTVKGSARMAGAMALGQHMHDMESRIEQLARHGAPAREAIEELSNRLDTALAMFERLQSPPAESAAATAEQPTGTLVPLTAVAPAPHTALAELEAPLAKAGPGPAVPLVRVRADVLDRLVNQAGEVSIARSRAETEIDGLRHSLSDLTENVARLRSQLREIEIQAESQMSSHMALASEREFDPLEFDRFTRLQELTRMMAESVSDVASLQGTLTRTLDNTGAALNNQARLTRDLQQDLMRVRMVQFGSIAERLYRVTRQAAKETDKRINLDLRGASVELDRGVLEKMAGPFEHLLRNAIVHGIESRAERLAAGKPEIGEIQVEVRQEGNEIVLQFADDGRGLDLARIGAKARQLGLLGENQSVGDEELRELIFHAGFTTAEEVTALAGRGVGMDAVRSEAVALGGRIAVQSEAGRGACFQVRLPLTLAVTQVVLLSAGGRTYAVPSVLVEQVQQLKSQPLAAAYNDNGLAWLGQRVPLHYLPALLGDGLAMPVTQQYSPVVIMRSAQDRVALHVDEVVGNREVVVKNVGPQLARLASVSGATVLGSGEVVLILNPVPLAQRATVQPMRAPRLLAGDTPQDLGAVAELKSAASAPVQGLRSQAVVMVVDDSLTVRRVTQRLLAREAYQVVLAKDGVEALEQLQSITPDVMLVDIEMPRMDGFDLTRNVRSDVRTRHIPIIMITSRTAEKHRNYAFELGVNEYLGKPFQELELLELVKGFVQSKEGAASQA
jgi:chemosensory pili system protein ChpA (sensor histidine kinase/response regulator)